MAIDDVPPLDDPSHNATRGELARLFVQHKAELGLAVRDDFEIVARVDDIAWHLWQRAALAAHTRQGKAFSHRWPWVVEVLWRLNEGQQSVPMDA